MALDINARSRVAKHASAIQYHVLFLLLGREEKFVAAAPVYGGSPRQFRGAPVVQQISRSFWEAKTMHVNGTAGADLYCSSNSSPMPPITAI
jgi:hypothetical protein